MTIIEWLKVNSVEIFNWNYAIAGHWIWYDLFFKKTDLKIVR